MDNNLIAQPQPPVSNTPQPAPKTHKKLIIVIVSIVVILAAAITAIILFMSNGQKQETSSTTDENINHDLNNKNDIVITYTKNPKYSEALNVFSNIHENIDTTTLQEILNQAKNGLTIHYSDDQTSGYIHNGAIQDVENYCDDEFITFNVDLNETSSDYNTIFDVTYHAPLSSGCSYILRNADGTFRHFTGHITSDFDTLEEAIDDHLIRY